ncbi:MAG: CotH kinase family protein, partial [Bacteroidaceae bacterium]|nr:CotH kinase family protein [Bacteroidaceae bacterium]
MKKRLYAALGMSLLLLVVAVSYFSKDTIAPKTLSESRLEKIQSEYDEGCFWTTLQFDDYTPAYDALSNTYFVVQDMESDRWEGVLTAEGCKLYSKKDSMWENRPEAVSSGHAFDLVLVDEENKEFKECKVVFTGMPVLSIDTVRKNARTLVEEDIEAWWGNFTLDSAEDGHQKVGASFKRRGATSYGLPKFSMRIELDDKLELLGMRKDDDWQLTGLYDDPGLIHNELSYTLWNQMAATNNVDKDETIKDEYVEVILDNEYMGVYLLQERFDAKKAQVTENDVIYKSWGFDYPDSVETLGRFAVQKYPDEATEETLTPLWDWCRCFWADEQLPYEEALEVIEYENTLDYTLFLDLTTATDNMRKNIYF